MSAVRAAEPLLRRGQNGAVVLAACLLSVVWFLVAWRIAYLNCFPNPPAGRVAVLVAFGIPVPILPAFVRLLGVGLAPQLAGIALFWKLWPRFAKTWLVFFCVLLVLYCLIVWLVFFVAAPS